MSDFPEDIFTEPSTVEADTPSSLGPLRRLAGVWIGDRGVDLNPKAEGPERRVYRERIEMQPIDGQANGPQLFYGLRYHVHVNARGGHRLLRPGRQLALEASDGACPADGRDPPGPGRDRVGPRRA